jgi:hypothetical protein
MLQLTSEGWTVCFELLQVVQVLECSNPAVVKAELLIRDDGTKYTACLYVMDHAAWMLNAGVRTKLQRRHTRGEWQRLFTDSDPSTAASSMGVCDVMHTNHVSVCHAKHRHADWLNQRAPVEKSVQCCSPGRCKRAGGSIVGAQGLERTGSMQVLKHSSCTIFCIISCKQQSATALCYYRRRTLAVVRCCLQDAIPAVVA